MTLNPSRRSWDESEAYGNTDPMRSLLQVAEALHRLMTDFETLSASEESADCQLAIHRLITSSMSSIDLCPVWAADPWLPAFNHLSAAAQTDSHDALSSIASVLVSTYLELDPAEFNFLNGFILPLLETAELLLRDKFPMIVSAMRPLWRSLLTRALVDMESRGMLPAEVIGLVHVLAVTGGVNLVREM